VLLGTEIVLPLLTSNGLPPMEPIVNVEGSLPLTPIVMLLMLSEELFMVIAVVLLVRKVAVSALVVPEVAPGNVSTPVLQLVSPPPGIQSALLGVALQVALAACEMKKAVPTIARTISDQIAGHLNHESIVRVTSERL